MHGTACSVESVFSDDSMIALRFVDGRVLVIPTGWFPSLASATADELKHYTITPFGVHWPTLNEDISVEGVIAGRGAQCLNSDVGASLSLVRKMIGPSA